MGLNGDSKGEFPNPGGLPDIMWANQRIRALSPPWSSHAEILFQRIAQSPQNRAVSGGIRPRLPTRAHRRFSGRSIQASLAVHFKHFAPASEYANQRYQFEARRHFAILDGRLATRRYMLGDTYTIVDMAMWGWARFVPFVIGDDGYGAFPHLKRLVDEISARPAAVRAMALKDRFTFTSGLDDEGRRHMFKHAQTAGG